jgi:antitoxin component of RelBE/YafQ-DinJ toxin-antitoxin module
MAEKTTLFRARVPSGRLKRAEKILGDLGIKPGDAFNMLLAQIELRRGLPFLVTTKRQGLLGAEEQGQEWNDALGPY